MTPAQADYIRLVLDALISGTVSVLSARAERQKLNAMIAAGRDPTDAEFRLLRDRQARAEAILNAPEGGGG